MALQLTADIRREVLATLDRLPRPASNAGKVTVTFEFNLDPAGNVGSVVVDLSSREQIRTR